MRSRPLPLPGLILALLTAVGMLVAGASLWLVVAVAVIWAGSLLLPTPERVVEAPPVEIDRLNDEAVSATIEPVGLPLLLLEGSRIVMANASARQALGAHIVGQDARIALRHPDAMRLLDMEDDASVTIAGFTGGRSLWQLTRRRIDAERWAIELADRTAESDISRAHTDFVANASHELRTPLAAIIGYVETLSEGSGKVEPETAARFHGIVLREARRMQNLVSDLMSLSQLEAEKHDVPREQIDLGQLAARVTGEFGATAGANRITLERPDAELAVLGDTKQLEQVLRNLIDNALKYGDASAPIRVRAEADGAKLAVLTVSDEGPGIEAEHLPLLTRRFYRTDPGRSRAGGGTGLGLAIVKHVVERHRGQLDIASTIGTGTTVTIALPLAGDT